MSPAHSLIPRRKSPPMGWPALAAASLALAGVMAAALVVGRAPVISEWITDPAFFRRALVVHVVLSLWGWFLAYAVGLRILVDGSGPRPLRVATWVGALFGIAIMVLSAGIGGAEPRLVNYIPVVDHPVFLTGLGLFFAAAMLQLCRWPHFRPPARRDIPAASAIAWRATAVPAAIAVVVFGISLVLMPGGLTPETHYELLFWGAGHVLQLVGVLAMLGAWYFLLSDRRGRSPVGTKASLGIAAALVLPWLISPFLVLGGPESPHYIRGFTRLMQFGIAGPVLIAIGLCTRHLWNSEVSTAGKWAFSASAALTVIGFVLGAMIRGDDTMIPGHYHASLGAITVVLMAVSYELIAATDWNPFRRRFQRLITWQPVAFGFGQLVFAVGFGLAGLSGLDRKAYGTEQLLDSPLAIAGTATMGIGGLVAVAAGVAFLTLMFIAAKHRFTHWRTP